MVMNLDYLSTLISIIEHGSLSAAARDKRIGQPAVTKQLQRIESEFGLSLLVRGPKHHVKLTPAGEKVVAFARETLARFAELERELATLKAVGAGMLSLAATPSRVNTFCPVSWRHFKKTQIQVEITIVNTSDVAARLAEDRRYQCDRIGHPAAWTAFGTSAGR